jgi:hypothetical protein
MDYLSDANVLGFGCGDISMVGVGGQRNFYPSRRLVAKDFFTRADGWPPSIHIASH